MDEWRKIQLGPKEDKLIRQVKSLRNAKTSDLFLNKNFPFFLPLPSLFLKVWVFLISSLPMSSILKCICYNNKRCKNNLHFIL